MLTKSEYEMIEMQTKQHDPELWAHLKNLWFGNNTDKSQNQTFRKPDGTEFDLGTMALFKTIKGRIYLVNTVEAAIYGSGRKASPQTPVSILRLINSQTPQFWKEMFEVEFNEYYGNRYPIISVSEDFMRDV